MLLPEFNCLPFPSGMSHFTQGPLTLRRRGQRRVFGSGISMNSPFWARSDQKNTMISFNLAPNFSWLQNSSDIFTRNSHSLLGDRSSSKNSIYISHEMLGPRSEAPQVALRGIVLIQHLPTRQVTWSEKVIRLFLSQWEVARHKFLITIIT